MPEAKHHDVEPTAASAPGLIGRDSVFGSLESHLNRARDGAGSTVVLSGGPGMGKTALIDAISERAGDFRVLRCHGVESEAELPFSGLHELLLPLLYGAADLEPPQRDALLGAFGIQPADEISSIDVAMGALTLIAISADRRPVLLLVEDLHWMDEASVRALSFVARRIPHDRVFTLMAMRPTHGGPTVDGLVIELDTLSTEETAALARRSTDRAIPDAIAVALRDATGGNPLAVIETVRDLGDAVDRLGTVLDEPPPASELIRRGFARRLIGLPEETMDALRVAATAIGDGSDGLHDALASLELPTSALDTAESAGIVRRNLGGVAFAHPLLRALVYHDSTPVQQRRSHAALAAVARDRGSRAWHAAAASEIADETVAAELDAAAVDFETRGGLLAAARALERAARLTPDDGPRADRLYRAGYAACHAARPQWASALFAEARRLATDERLLLRIDQEDAFLQGLVGPATDLLARYLELADRAERVAPELLVDSLCDAAAEGILAGAMGAAEVAIDRLRALDAQQDPWLAEEIKAWIGVVLVLSGRDPREGAELLARTGTARLTLRPIGHTYVIEALIWIEQYALAERLAKVQLAAARARGNLKVVAGTQWVDGYRLYRTGDWAGAASALEASLHLSETTEQHWHLAFVAANLAILRGSQGDPSARELVARADALAIEHGYDILEPYFATALGILELGAGHGDAAVVHLERAARWAARSEQTEPGVLPWQADLVEAYLLAGQREHAMAALEQLRERSEATGRIWALAAVARLDGLLTEQADYEASFDRAIELHAQSPAPFDLARTHLAYGRRLRAAGHRYRARRHFDAALRGFERLGATVWVQQAAGELGSAAASAQSEATPRHEQLTGQETLVAEAVAQGLANKQIAAQLFLTTKTIEWHLSRIYRKLGVDSRTQLALHMRSAGPGA